MTYVSASVDEANAWFATLSSELEEIVYFRLNANL
jgi:hypothetical protein